MNEITVKTEYSEKEIRFLIKKAYFTKEMKKRLLIAAIVYFLGAAIMFAYSSLFSFKDKPFLKVIMLGFALLLFLLGIFKKKVSVFVSYRRYQKAIAKNPDLFSPITYTFRSDGIIIESNVGKTETKWDAYTVWGQLDGFLYIMRKDNKMAVVNLERVTHNEYETLIKIVSSNVAPKADGIKQ